jgi:photosystem II stability/assembly factor-like uncharacterized protein
MSAPSSTQRRPLRWWLSQATPFAVIGALLVVAFRFELAPIGSVVHEAALGPRDRVYAVLATDRQLLLAGSGGKVVKSRDEGKTWKVVPSGTSAHLQALLDVGAGRVVAAGNGGTFLFSDDSGDTWRKAAAPSADDIVKVMNLALQPGTGQPWAVAHFGAVLTSVDRGATWARVTPKDDVIWNAIAFASPDTGFVVGEFGRMLATHDGGRTWQAVAPMLKSSLNAIAFRDASLGVAVGTEGAVLVTQDAGLTWQRVDSGSKEHLYDVVVEGERWIAVGNKGALLSGSFDGAPGARVSNVDLGIAWYTRVLPVGKRLYLAGAAPGVVENGRFVAFH